MQQISLEQTSGIEKQSMVSKTASNVAPQRLLIVSHVIHYRHEGRLYAYGPYAREIDIWADLFPQVTIAAPCRDAAPPSVALAFTRSNISIRPQLETGGKTRAAKIKQVVLLPALVWNLSRAMRESDAVHVRFPASLGLLGVLLAPLFSKNRVAKYAGQWNGYEGERMVLRLQRKLLQSSWWNAPVTVYGKWENQPAHIIPFFTSMMTAEQVKRAATIAREKEITSPLRVLFSGRLETEKRVDALLKAIKIARDEGVALEVAIVGDGRERERLESLVNDLGIEREVKFVGAFPFDESLKWYEWAHCLVLPSVNSEGFPKVIAEAMCHGLICVAVEHGQVPTMLKGKGILIEDGSPEEIAAALQRIAKRPDEYKQVMQAASIWAQQFSLEGLRDALAQLLSEKWRTQLSVNEKRF